MTTTIDAVLTPERAPGAEGNYYQPNANAIGEFNAYVNLLLKLRKHYPSNVP